MSGYDYDGGPPQKRQRPERETIENPPEFFNTSQVPSKVLHVGDLHPRAQEPDLLEAFGRFGRIAYVVIKRQPRNNMGLVEFDSMDGSASAMVGIQSQPANVCQQPVTVNYSAIQKIPRFGFESDCPNKVLVVFVSNVQFNINAFTLHDICKAHGTVLRVAVVKRHPILTALIEFETIEMAKTCKYAINGADIYTNSCTIKVEFAKIPNVRITIPDDDHADFTGGPPAENPQHPGRRTLMGAPPDRPAYPGAGPYGAPGGYGRDARGLGGGYARDSRSSGDGYGAPPPPPPPPVDPARAWEQNYGLDQYPSWRPAAPLLDGSGDYRGRFDTPDGRGPNELLAGGPGCCLLIGGLDHSKINCDKLFNLLCSYGNILRIMFMRKKTDLALVEMGHPYHAQDCVQNLRKITALGMEIEVSRSNQPGVNHVNDPFALPDGTLSYKDFSTLKLNRYTTRENADKNRPCPPQSCLHWFNAPPDMDEAKLKEALTKAGVSPPINVTQHRLHTGRSAAGTCEFASVQDATEALIVANHTPVISPDSRNPYMLKLAYTKARGHNDMYDRGGQNWGQAPTTHPYGRT